MSSASFGPGGVRWTSEQWAGISTTGRSLLVSAAAGSGKTAVLAERCAYLVCDAQPPCDVDRLLVVTFTDAAAAEMRSRIEQALRQRLEQGDDPRLHRELALIERAQISTLHGFCARLLRQYYHLVGLGPDFRILDGSEAALLRHEVARDLFDDRYESEGAADFQRFVDDYGDGMDDKLLRKVVQTHEMLRSLVDPQAWLTSAPQRIAEGAQKPLAKSELGRQLLQMIRRQLADVESRCKEAAKFVTGKKGLEKYCGACGELAAALSDWRDLLDRGDLDALAARVGEFEPPRKPSVRNDVAGKEQASEGFDAVRDAMKPAAKGTLSTLLRFTEKQWRQGLNDILPMAEVFLGLISEFAQRYERAKRLSRGIDFSDLEVLTLRVLRDAQKPGLAPSAAARACRRQFEHVLVDEYQDINEVQDAILHLLSRDDADGTAREPLRGNLFCVGDVKQSIYRFRLAEPKRFLERDRAFRGGKNPNGTVIDLQANFRSRSALLETLNGLFEKLMTQEAADIEYDQSHHLHAGKTFLKDASANCFSGSPVELHLIGDGGAAAGENDAEEVEESAGDDSMEAEFDRTEKEAALVAHRIHELLGNCETDAMQVLDRDENGLDVYRKIQFRDIVILLRSMQFKAEQFAEQLRLAGIPTHRDSSTGYFNSMEVRDVLALLRVLDNQRQDVPLAAVLRSPLLRISQPEEAMAQVRIAYPNSPRGRAMPFHEAIVRYVAEKNDAVADELRRAIEQLAEWRQLSQQRPLAEVLWTIYQATGYLSFVGGLTNGRQRVANLLDLHERAKQFGAFSRQGLFRFLHFLEALADEGDLGLPSVLGAADDVVRIMSIHRAKGLEFPVVFVPDMGKRINLQDCGGSIVVDRHEFLGMSVVDERRQVRYPSLASTLVQQRLRQQSLAEELRVLYVATTRAREHLILVGTAGQREERRWQAACRNPKDPLTAEQILSAATMLDWVGPVALMLESAGSFSITRHAGGEIAEWAAQTQEARKDDAKLQAIAALRPLPSKIDSDAPDRAAEVIARLSRPYEFAELARSAASHPAAAWAKSLAAAEPKKAAESVSLGKPKFALETVELSPTEKGDATHIILEHLDFHRTCCGDDLEAQISAMVEGRFLTAAQAGAVDRKAIEWFMQSAPGQLAQATADGLRREQPFQMAIQSAASSDPRDAMIVRGRIDLMIPRKQGWIIVDYKTDRVQSHEKNRLGGAYAAQADLYRKAVESMSDEKVSAVYLVYLAGQFVHEL